MRRTSSILLVGLAAATCRWAPPGPVVTGVTPARAPADADTAVAVRGASFVPAVRADLDRPEQSQAYAGFTLELVGDGERRVALTDVTLVSEGELRAVLRSGAAAGTYDLLLTDPRGRTASLAAALTVYVAGCAEDGASCDDGDACTVGDRCGGNLCRPGTPVGCAPLDACHGAGTCDPATGLCSSPPAPDGTPCDDGDLCTQVDACVSGACAGSSPVVCAPLDACHLAGACDPATGLCANPAAPDGTRCQSVCAAGETCLSGTCALPPGGCLATAPLASLVVTPIAVRTGSAATFDASGSTDAEEPTAALTAEFDFDGTGTFSAGRAATQPATHVFAVPGTYQAWVRVTDSSGLAAYASARVIVADAASLVVVTTPADESDPNATPDVPGGTGLSLREAVTYVNGLGAPRIVTFAGPYAIAMSGAQRTLALTAPETSIVGGPGVTVSFGGYKQACVRLSAPGQSLVGVALLGCDSVFVEVLPGSTGSRVSECSIGPGSPGARGVHGLGDSGVVGPGNVVSGVDVGVWLDGDGWTVTGNRITGNATGVVLNGQGVRVVANAIFGQVGGSPLTGDGLRIYASAAPVEVWHNTVHGNASDGVHADDAPLDLRNNLFTRNGGYGVQVPAARLGPYGPNGFDGNGLGALSVPPPGGGTNDVRADPRYVAPSAGDLRLQPGSPAIDAGTPIPGLDVNGPGAGLFDGLAPDLGAVESPY